MAMSVSMEIEKPILPLLRKESVAPLPYADRAGFWNLRNAFYPQPECREEYWYRRSLSLPPQGLDEGIALSSCLRSKVSDPPIKRGDSNLFFDEKNALLFIELNLLTRRNANFISNLLGNGDLSFRCDFCCKYAPSL